MTKHTKKKSAASSKFKKGVAEYKSYKRKNPNGTKKIQSFIKEAFKK